MLSTHVLTSATAPRVGHSVVAYQVVREPYSEKIGCQKITTHKVVECSQVEDSLYRFTDTLGIQYLCKVI